MNYITLYLFYLETGSWVPVSGSKKCSNTNKSASVLYEKWDILKDIVDLLCVSGDYQCIIHYHVYHYQIISAPEDK